jgi:peptidyl-prolyl cis-trans isomerase C
MIIRFILLALSIGMLLAGRVDAEDLNPVAGKTGDFVLREADLDRLLSNLSPEVQKSIENSPEQRSNFIRQFLLTKATASRARKEGFDRKPEVKELLSNLIDQFLAQEYLNKVVIANITITDDELKKYYAEHENEFLVPEAVKARHIFIASSKDSAVELKEKARLKAEVILEKIRKGEDFAKTAREQSEDADTAAKDGDLGYITEGKTNSLEFEKAVFALKSGETSNIVETPFGYHIIRIDDRKEKRTATLDEAKDYMTNLLREEQKKKKAQEFVEMLTRETGLEVTGKPTDARK